MRRSFGTSIINFFKMPSPGSSPQMSSHKRAAKTRTLIQKESAVGATVFGPIPAGHRREFFCLDEHTWVWFEEWVDKETHSRQTLNVHYEFQPRGVLKIVNGVASGYVTGQELVSLLTAMRAYYKKVSKEVYGLSPAVI